MLTGLSQCLLALTRHLSSNSTAFRDQVFSTTASMEYSRSKLETRKPFFSLRGLILLYDFIICMGVFPAFWFLYVLEVFLKSLYIYIAKCCKEKCIKRLQHYPREVQLVSMCVHLKSYYWAADAEILNECVLANPMCFRLPIGTAYKTQKEEQLNFLST